MQDNILVVTYNLSFIIKRLEKLICEKTNYEIEQQIKLVNEKVFEINDTIETIQVMRE